MVHCKVQEGMIHAAFSHIVFYIFFFLYNWNVKRMLKYKEIISVHV